MPSPFTNSLDVKLIELVKDHPILYNARHSKYLDFDSREVVWHKIGDILSRPAVEFAAIQCQIHYGDFQADKHVPGFIENLNEFLPEQYSKSWGIEKKALKLYRQHHGLAPVEAKHLYTKTARDLPTYGVSFFVVKEKQKGKKKLVPRLLGINAESILRLDEVTKEILQQWKLTQVMSYHASKSDTFSLNFGDYSEKEYCVKTNDAYRIREILEGYIDIIRRRLGAPRAAAPGDSGVVGEDDVQAGRCNLITHVTNNPSKLVEHSFVGPSRVVDYVQGTEASAGGTHIMTVQQVVSSSRGSVTHQALKSGEVPLRRDMSLEFVKKLNRMNSSSVGVVGLMGDPTDDNVKEARALVDAMREYMPDIITGVKQAAEKQSSEEARKKLLAELDELVDYLHHLAGHVKPDHFNPEGAQEHAKKIADLTTQMYFSVDPRTLRRSALLRRSRQSFLADEQTEAALRRAAALTAAAGAAGAAAAAAGSLTQHYQGPRLTDVQLQELEAAAISRAGKLNAAVGLHLIAHSDPKNVDYSVVVASMNTINELVPELTRDTTALGSSLDGPSRDALLDELRALCEAAGRLCSLTGADDREKVQEAANSYADVSGKLIYTLGRRTRRLDPDLDNKIVELSKEVGDVTSALLMKVNELTFLAESEPGAGELDDAGVGCADCARDLLATAQLTAPTIHEPHCQSALTAAAENLSSSAQRLAVAWRPLAEHQDRHQISEDLKEMTMELARALDRLRNAYVNLEALEDVPDADDEERTVQGRRLRFLARVAAARCAQQEMDEQSQPPAGGEPASRDAKSLAASLWQSIAELNAAVAALIQAMADPDNSDYEASERSMATITELMPAVVKDSKTLSASSPDAAAREAALQDLRSWCRALDAVCASLGDPRDLDESAQCFAKASQKLSFVFSPRVDKAREQLIMELSELAHGRAMQLADETNSLAGGVGGESGGRLGGTGREVGRRAEGLRTAARLTAPTIHSAQCQTLLLASVDSLSSSAQQLDAEAARLQDHETGCSVLSSQLRVQREGLHQHVKELETHLDGIRDACQEEGCQHRPGAMERAVEQSPSTHDSVAESHVVAQSVPKVSDTRALVQDFIHQLRCEESQNIADTTVVEQQKDKLIEISPHEVKTVQTAVEENHQEKQFADSLKDMDRSFVIVEEELKKLDESPALVMSLDRAPDAAARAQLEQRVARAATAAAGLLGSQHADKTDHTTAIKNAQTLSSLMPLMVEDAAVLAAARSECSRRQLLDELRALNEATRSLCTAAAEERQTLNEAAVTFGDKSARLLYIISADVDPAQEKEVISRAKAIGDSASRLALGGATVATRAGAARAQDICEAGGRAADAAAALVYTAKLVAPSIQHDECQNSLVLASEDLSSQLRAFINTWPPVSSDPDQTAAITELSNESEILEKLLQQFREDLTSGKFVMTRNVEKVVVEDMPLRRLALKIFEDAKGRAEAPAAGAARRALADHANRLAAALQLLDATHARARLAPQDVHAHRELQNAVQNVQVLVLQGRPSRGDQPPGNVVDVTDYVRDISSEAENLMQTANNIKVSQAKGTLEDIKQECHKLSLGAFRVVSPARAHDEHDAFEDMLEVHQFGQECEERVQTLNALIQGLEDEGARAVLGEQAAPLGESCNLLRFATESALSSAQGAALDEALEDLQVLEKRLDFMLLPAGAAVAKTEVPPPPAVQPRAQLACAAARAAQGHAQALAPSFTAYVTALRRRTDLNNAPERDRLKQHLQQTVKLLRALSLSTAARVAAWQPLPGAGAAGVVQQLVQELEGYDAPEDAAADEVQVLSAADLGGLLVPRARAGVQGGRREIEDKLQQTAAKLTSITGTILLSAPKPGSLARSAHTAAAAAEQLMSSALALRTDSAVQNKRIEEASQEMSLATYSLLKAAESVSQEPKNALYRRRLMDACRLLNDSINKLVGTTSTKQDLRGVCGDLSRCIQTQQNLQQCEQPSCALPYSECVDAFSNQLEIMHKTESEGPLPRAEFLRAVRGAAAAACGAGAYAAHCAYLISISERHRELAARGAVDAPLILKLTAAAQAACGRVLCTGNREQAKVEVSILTKISEDLKRALEVASSRAKGDCALELSECGDRLEAVAKSLQSVSDEDASTDKMNTSTMALLDVLGDVQSAAERPSLLPLAGDPSSAVRGLRDDVITHSKSLLSRTQSLVKEVGSGEGPETMTWVTYGVSRRSVLDAFEALLDCLRQNGRRAGLLESPRVEEAEEDAEASKKSYVQMQVDVANRWLCNRLSSPRVQAEGEKAAGEVILIADQVCEELQGQEKEHVQHVSAEAAQLLRECGARCDADKAAALSERLRELGRGAERALVSRVVDDFVGSDAPLHDLDVMLDSEPDAAKRKFLLEQSIAALLAQLGRATRTARCVARARAGGDALDQCREQTELLAPMLVKAAQDRVNTPDDASAVERYKALLAQYTEALSRVRDQCDLAVDPMDFVQTAGETMQRMREESSGHNDPLKCVTTSVNIQRLAKRVIYVGLSSPHARRDPELQRALADAQQKLSEAAPAPGARSSHVAAGWKDTADQFIRATGEVESVFSGEAIFKKEPEPDQPIYNAALNLHAAVREWSGRDNEIVAVAKRMAVLMARLSQAMNTDKKRELLSTSKAIVSESHEVARLAKKIAHECTDIRIRTNLLQVCERIPTISGQLKMLTTVKGWTLGQQGTEEDKEAMNTLVGNAQNLMLSVQEVVKAAASASVKIAAERGATRMRWVRRYY